ncbi:hypothetical protein D3C71_910030 [compost metagenome]
MVQVQQSPVVAFLAQYLVRHDGIQNGLLLPPMEVQALARQHHVLAKPPQQQLRSSGRHQFQNICRARLQPQTQLLGLGSQACGQGQLIIGFGAHAAPTVVTTSASKPNTSTTRTHTLRGPSLAGAVTVAEVTTRSASASLAVLPR